MINEARKYLGVGKVGVQKLMSYYNEACYPYVKPERKYKIQPNDEWCAMFVSTMAFKTGFKGLFTPEVSAQKMLDNLTAAGCKFSSSKAVPNDLCFFDWNGNGQANHVGIVAKLEGGYLTTLEGNKGGTVDYRTTPLKSRSILAVCSPVPLIEIEVGTLTEYVEQLARGVIRGLYGEGQARKIILGVYYESVQAKVNELLNQ